MPQDDTQQRQQEPQGSTKGGWWGRFNIFVAGIDREFSFVKGLSVITALSGLLVGYFQYLGAYGDKVNAQAKDDMTAATAAFMDISNAFSEAQTLQQILYFDFAGAIDDKSDTNEQALSTKNAHDIYPAYEAARTKLRQNTEMLARRAEIYIDWPSDLNRDPAAPRTPGGDPLAQSLLGAYNFNCDDRSNFPQFGNPAAKKKSNDAVKSNEPACVTDKDQKIYDPETSYVNLCARQNGAIVPSQPAITIHWYSAKHHVLTMHYCFEAAHRRIEAARDWASKSELSEQKRNKLLAERDQAHADLDNQVIRLNAFMSLAMLQLEKIRVKYRPVGYLCHLPLVRDLIDLFDRSCTPIKTATGQNH